MDIDPFLLMELRFGIPKKQVVQHLVDANMQYDDAVSVVDQIDAHRKKLLRRKALKRFGEGLGLGALGAGVTYATWYFAPGGMVFVAGGAIMVAAACMISAVFNLCISAGGTEGRLNALQTRLTRVFNKVNQSDGSGTDIKQGRKPRGPLDVGAASDRRPWGPG